jgi:CRISPR-associated exonuclease Cas4
MVKTNRETHMYSDDEIVLISALEHYSYCPRQCALIHIERVFDENVFTLRGRHAHERADEQMTTVENGVRIERALPLWSDALGLQGRGDVVEFHPDGRVVPVEYKHGPRRERRHDDLQLCAQALCLEEMLNVEVPRGAIYSIQTRRRRDVIFDNALRAETKTCIEELRVMVLGSGPLPPAVNDKRCPRCSLIDACVPATVVAARQARLARGLYQTPIEDETVAQSRVEER